MEAMARFDSDPIGTPAKILLVDDQPANSLVLEAILSSLGHPLLKARSGDEALRQLRDEDFAVVLLDVQMPVLDGFQTAHLIRQQERSRHTPIILVTAYGGDDFPLAKAYALGAVDYLIKPLVPEILRAKVSVFVELFQKSERIRQMERRDYEYRLGEEKRRWEFEHLRRQAAGYAVTQILATFTTLQETMSEALSAVCQSFSWDAGGLWQVDQGDQKLRCVTFWHRLQNRGEAFQAASLELRLAKGQGFPGRVWQSGKPVWVADIGRDDNFPRRLAAIEAELHAGIALPVVMTNEIVGVLEFFSQSLREPDEELLQFLAALAGQIGLCLERQRAEDEVRRQRELYRVTLASIGDAVISTDREGQVTFLNAIAATLIGLSPEQINGQKLDQVFRIINERTRQPAENPVKRVLEEGVMVGLANHTVLISAQGQETPIDDSAAPIRHADGSLAGVVLVFRDVKEVRRATDARQRLAAIVESSDDAIVRKDLNGVVQTWNRGAERIFGYTAEEMVGQPITLILPPDQLQEEAEILDKLRRGERIDHFETVRVRKDGRRVDVSVTISPIRDLEGEIVGASKIARDITEQKRTQQALLEEDRRKDEFLAMLGHELRNPLAPIRNALHIMRMPGASRETIEQAQEMTERQVQQLVRLVDDLLDVSRVMRGRIELRKELVELSTVIARAVEMAQPLLDGQGQQLVVSLSAEPIWLDADVARITQVLGNLLNNAAKFSQRSGRVWLSADRDSNTARISIKDEGAGIAPALLPHIFDLFVQGDTSLGRSRGGLGVGLTVASRLVELHGGTITAKSEVGKGSEFVVKLPLLSETPKQNLAVATASAPAISRRVLVVDDNVDAAESEAILLRLEGHTVRVVHDGLAALAAVGEFQPEVMLLDIGLPGMNGYEVAQQLRSQFADRRLVVIAVSGYGQEQDRRRSLEAGCDYHLTKPVDPDVIREFLNGLA
jgi:PAS domain S-box-containing protein